MADSAQASEAAGFEKDKFHYFHEVTLLVSSLPSAQPGKI
jgi:hypothetical protein